MKETGPSYDKKLDCSDNLEKGIQNRIERSGKIGQGNNRCQVSFYLQRIGPVLKHLKYSYTKFHNNMSRTADVV